MEPKFAFMLCSNQMFEMQLAVPSSSTPRVSRFPRAAKMGRMVITDYLHKVLPPGCPIVGSVSDGIVGEIYCNLLGDIYTHTIRNGEAFYVSSWKVALLDSVSR